MKPKTVIEMGRGSCPAGKVRRKPYTRSDGTRVKPSCVVDQGKRGKTPKSEQVLPKPKAGKLMGWKTDLSTADRRLGPKRFHTAPAPRPTRSIRGDPYPPAGDR